jgi:hypothetical protein
MTEVSAVRLYALRLLYLLNFVGLGAMVWPAVLSPARPLGLLDGVAFSFWAAFSALMASAIGRSMGLESGRTHQDLRHSGRPRRPRHPLGVRAGQLRAEARRELAACRSFRKGELADLP